MPQGRAMKRPNGYGTVAKLSGRRRRPYEVRVNTIINEWGFPCYDVLGRFAERKDAEIALAEYNRNPFDIKMRSATFSEVYNLWFDWKYTKSAKSYSASSISCTKGAYRYLEPLYKKPLRDIRADDMQRILDNHALSHAYMEHILNLLHQMFKYALEYDIIEKDYSRFLHITKPEDDKAGVPFTNNDIRTLWEHVEDIPDIDIVLILIYTGWRITELLTMATANIDLTNWTMTGGIKTDAGKNRVVPIHSDIKDLVMKYYSRENVFFLASPTNNSRHISDAAFRKRFKTALSACGIQEGHTPHDCRHTFASLLNTAGANDVCIDRLLGHTSSTLTKRTYTHKDIEELRQAVELIRKPPV